MHGLQNGLLLPLLRGTPFVTLSSKVSIKLESLKADRTIHTLVKQV